MPAALVRLGRSLADPKAFSDTQTFSGALKEAFTVAEALANTISCAEARVFTKGLARTHTSTQAVADPKGFSHPKAFSDAEA